MGKLLIIADDFTGALDTGVQFASRGARTRVVTDPDYDFSLTDSQVQVLVMDAETRHVTPQEAYKRVFRVVQDAQKAGFNYIYKKTDSALRGNIGQEMAAVLDASGAKTLPFIPAFPTMNRVTRNGVHYIDDVPVAESAFGLDPFEPVRFSEVKRIVGEQSDTPVTVCTADQRRAPLRPGIQVFDASTDEDLAEIGRELEARQQLRVSAGCAGFAAELAKLLALDGPKPQMPALVPSFFMVCGSVNPVTKRQIETAIRDGFTHVRLGVLQKLSPMWTEGADCSAAIEQWLAMAAESGRFILDTNDPEGTNETVNYAGRHGLTMEQVRVQISSMLGTLMKKMLSHGLNATLMCTGGDTLLALMHEVEVPELTPVCELAPGVVLTDFAYQQKHYHIITKSGGFGEPDLLVKLVKLIGVERQEEKTC